MLKKANSEHQYTYSVSESKKIMNKKVEQGKNLILNEKNYKACLNHGTKYIQNIPNKLIEKSRHKYLFKKALINTKFEWLNRYLQTSETSSASLNVKSAYPHYSYLKQKQSNPSQTDQHIQRNQTRLGLDKRNNKCMTEHVHDNYQGKYKQYAMDFTPQSNKQKQHQNEQFDSVFQQLPLNCENRIKIKKSKSTKQKSKLKQVIHSEQNQMGFYGFSQTKNKSTVLQNYYDKQNGTQILKLSRPNIKITKYQLQSSPMLVKASEKQNENYAKTSQNCLKNRKKEYIYRSREERRQPSQFLKRKTVYNQEIKVQPWKLQQDYNDDMFLMN